MQKTVMFHGKSVDVTLTPRAAKMCKAVVGQLILEVQVYFSCVLVKRVAIYADAPQDGTWQLEPEQFAALLQQSQPLCDRLSVRFNTVMTTICPVTDYLGPPPVTDFKIHREGAYVPRWLTVDYRDGKWFGDYGWHASSRGDSNTVQIRAGAIKKD